LPCIGGHRDGRRLQGEEGRLSLAIGTSLSSTLILMVMMPLVMQAMGMSNVLGGAWVGGPDSVDTSRTVPPPAVFSSS
jgi:hypothetical protein